MKRWVVGGLLAVAVALTGSIFWAQSASASGTDVVWKTVRLPWASAAAALTGDSTIYQAISGINDSTRTGPISTADWAFDWAGGLTAAGGAHMQAIVECDCKHVAVAANDSLYFTIEKRNRQGKWNYNTTAAGTLGYCMTLTGLSQPTQASFRGVVLYDNDNQATTGYVYPGDEIRFVVKGDVGASSPVLGQCQFYITYPSRRASQ